MGSNKQLGLQNLPGHNDFEITRFDYLLCLFLNMRYSFHQKPWKITDAFPSLSCIPVAFGGRRERAPADRRPGAVSFPGVL